jgi:soluble lytic murein transglycosylase
MKQFFKTIFPWVCGPVIAIIFALTFNFSLSKLKQKPWWPKNEPVQIINTNEKKIECMAKTLMVVYGISKWEAHYYSIVFNDFSENYGIPWEIYPAIIRIESNFKPTLVSNKQARGLMQVLNSTAAEECKFLEIEYVEGHTLWNEVCNLAIGCNYLSRMIKKKGLDGGVRCYLGGPGATAINTADSSGAQKAQYVSEYKTSVWKEYKELTYTFKGIVAEAGQKYEEMHPCTASDSVRINIKLFNLE